MACCLTAPSHYLNRCWLLISKVLWHSLESNGTASKDVKLSNGVGIYAFKMIDTFPLGQRAKKKRVITISTKLFYGNISWTSHCILSSQYSRDIRTIKHSIILVWDFVTSYNKTDRIDFVRCFWLFLLIKILQSGSWLCYGEIPVSCKDQSINCA